MKLFRLTLFVFVLVFVLGMTRWSMALESKSKVRVFRLDEKVETLPKLKQTNRRGGYKRVMADRADIRVVDQLRLRGCVMRHRLRREVSFDCPEEMVFELGVREARIFQIMDLRAGEQIKADQVWQEGIRGAGVGVVVLDTGVDSGHVELSDSILGQKDFVDNDDIAEDPNGHGTHVVGIITANGINQVNGNYATGVAPESGIYMLRVCDANGSCFEDDMMAAMEYAVNNLTGAKVMSISIGGGNYGSDCDDDPLAAKVNWVANNGFLVTVAAGNDGSGVSSPACASKAMAIGTVDETGIVPLLVKPRIIFGYSGTRGIDLVDLFLLSD